MPRDPFPLFPKDPMPTPLPHLEGAALSGRAVRFPADLPGHALVLIVGFTHGARGDVGAWKAALEARGIPFLSLPVAAVDQAPVDMMQVGRAMRSHLPREAWDGVIQIHKGGEALRLAFGWKPDGFAKLLRISPEGLVAASHDAGPFSPEALEALLG
jgi:hypothetical protein